MKSFRNFPMLVNDKISSASVQVVAQIFVFVGEFPEFGLSPTLLSVADPKE